jgi:hypothetical protein
MNSVSINAWLETWAELGKKRWVNLMICHSHLKMTDSHSHTKTIFPDIEKKTILCLTKADPSSGQS